MKERTLEPLPDQPKRKLHQHRFRTAVPPVPPTGPKAAPFQECVTCYTTREITPPKQGA